jgi:MscS family membrane protein
MLPILKAQTITLNKADTLLSQRVKTSIDTKVLTDSPKKHIELRETVLIHDTALKAIHDTLVFHDTLTMHDTIQSKSNLLLFPEETLKIEESFSFWKIILSIVLILLGGWINWRLNKFYLKYHIIEKFKYADFLKMLFHILLSLLLAYIILFLIIKPSSYILLVLGVGLLLMFALSSTDFVKNVIGGITLLLDRPFTYGDWIKIGEFYGKVRAKSFRSVEIITLDDSIINIPNQLFLREPVENLNVVSKNKQVNIAVRIPTGVEVIAAKKVLFEVATTSVYNSTSKPVEVTFKGLSPDGLNEFNIKAFVFDAKYENELRTNILETINNIFVEHFKISHE